MRLLFMGTPEFACPTLAALLDDDGHRHGPNPSFLSQQVFRINMKVNGPTKLRNPLNAAIQDVELYIAPWAFEQVKACPTHSAVVQSF